MNPIYSFCQDYFRFCREQGFRTLLLRPFYNQQLFQTNDIDVLIDARNIPGVIAWIEANGYIITWHTRRHDGQSVFLFREGVGFHVDFIDRLNIRGIRYVSVPEVFHRAITLNDMTFPGPEDQAVILLMLHGFKHRSESKLQKYTEFMQYVRKENPDSLAEKLSGLIGHDNALQVEEEIKKQGTAPTMARVPFLRFMAMQWPTQGMNVFLQPTIYFIEEFCRRIMAKRVTIGVYGVDGSGKTTIINALNQDMCFAPNIRYCHFLPSLPWRFEANSDIPMTNPHAMPARGDFSAILKMAYYILRYWLAWLWPRHGGTLFIYDRYIWDVLVDPLRARFKNKPFLKKFCKLLPKQDGAVLVDISPETAHARKAEMPMTETARQVQAYRDIILSMPNTLVIRGDVPVPMTSFAVLKHIARICHEKT